MESLGVRIRKVVQTFLIMTFGTILYCMSWTSILIPAGIASGGLTGLCTIIQFGTGIPVAYSFIVLNVILLIIGVIVLGKGFGIWTIYVIILSTVLFDVLPRFDILVLTFDDKLFAAVVGALVMAVGIGIILMKGGSTGGTDIVAVIVNKYWPISPGKIYLYTDLFIIASILLVSGKGVNDMVYGYVAMIVFSFAVDWVMMGNKTSVQMLIFSDMYEQIADTLVNEMDRGATVLKAEGWYSKREKNVLLVICRKQQYTKITEMVKNIDPKAFVSISATNSVYGEGFEEIKTGMKATDFLGRRKKRESRSGDNEIGGNDMKTGEEMETKG